MKKQTHQTTEEYVLLMSATLNHTKADYVRQQISTKYRRSKPHRICVATLIVDHTGKEG